MTREAILNTMIKHGLTYDVLRLNEPEATIMLQYFAAGD